jgi:hypothetical protein
MSELRCSRLNHSAQLDPCLRQNPLHFHDAKARLRDGFDKKATSWRWQQNWRRFGGVWACCSYLRHPLLEGHILTSCARVPLDELGGDGIAEDALIFAMSLTHQAETGSTAGLANVVFCRRFRDEMIGIDAEGSAAQMADATS